MWGTGPSPVTSSRYSVNDDHECSTSKGHRPAHRPMPLAFLEVGLWYLYPRWRSFAVPSNVQTALHPHPKSALNRLIKYSPSAIMLLSLANLSVLGLFMGVASAVPTERNNDNKKARSTTYSECQRPKPQGQQLQGCPDGTLYVSQTDPQAEYGTVSRMRCSVREYPFLNTCRVDSKCHFESVSAECDHASEHDTHRTLHQSQ